MINQPITSEELAYIDRFLRGEMTEEERDDFHARMESEDSLREKVRGVELTLLGIGEASLEERMDAFHTEMGGDHAQAMSDDSPMIPARKASPFWSKPWVMAAAVGLILAVSLWLLLADRQHDLYAVYYKPDPGLMTTMSATDHYELERAMVAYKNGEYKRAIEAWSQQLKIHPSSDTLVYFMGAAYQAMGNLDSAGVFLQRITSQPGSGFYKDASWYLGLLYIKMNKPAEATPHLKRSGRSKAVALIQRLKEQ